MVWGDDYVDTPRKIVKSFPYYLIIRSIHSHFYWREREVGYQPQKFPGGIKNATFKLIDDLNK